MGKKNTKAKVESIATPETLDEALAVIEAMRATVESAVEKMEELGVELATKNARIEELEGELSQAEDRVDEMEGEMLELEYQVALDGEAIEELSCIEQKMKRGRPDAEVRGDLDRLLQKIDRGGKHRMAAVPVML